MLIRVESYPDTSGTVAQTIHACLATSSVGDGVLFQAGRKLGDVSFSTDKTVSRNHCVVRCVGTLEDLLKPRTPQEKEACQKNGGMCLVLENLSKAGSFVAALDTASLLNKVAEVDDSATEDDETDDEGISQELQKRSQMSALSGDLPPVSAASRSFYGQQPVILEKLDKDDHTVLKLSPETPQVIVQLGRSESTIKVTLIPQRVQFSNMKSTKFESWLPNLHKIGFVKSDEMPTHLVTSELNAGAKQIIAWSSQIPIVSMDYLKACQQRTSPADALPDPKSFVVQKNSNATINFWDQSPNSKLLRNFTALCLEPGDFEGLSRAAGAAIVRLYTHKTRQEQIHKAKLVLRVDKNTIPIVENLASNKQIRAKLASMGVYKVDKKKIAKTICNQLGHLMDTNGTKLGEETLRKKNTSQTSKLTEKPQDEEDSPPEMQDYSPPEPSMVETQCLLDPTSQLPPSLLDTSNESIIEVESQEKPTTKKRSRDEVENVKDDKPDAIPQKKNKTTLLPSSTLSQQDKLQNKDKNGWFTTAPKEDSKRMEWHERSIKLLKEEGMEDLDPAETENISIVSALSLEQHSRLLPSRRRNKNVPDFRRFRKNIVPKANVIVNLCIYKAPEAKDKEAFDEQEQALADEQRRADALFRGDGAATKKRRRRLD